MQTRPGLSRRDSKAGLSYDQLECKNLLTGITLDPSTGILLIEGSLEEDHVFVSSLSETEIQVEFVDFETRTFARSDVISIRFNGRALDDSFTNDTDIASKAFGNGGNDVLNGGLAEDVLSGGGGDDTLSGNGGDDDLRGGPGNDNLDGGDGNDLLSGYFGDDTITGSDGNDIIFGGKGNDDIDAGIGDDTVYGQEGDDVIEDAVFSSMSGNDSIYGNAGNDMIIAGPGDDIVYGGDGDDNIRGFDGNDEIRGGTGDDNIRGDDGNDLIFGNDGDDRLTGGFRADVIYGGNGDDHLDGGSGGRDILYGGNGDDSLFAGPGQGFDKLFGGDGDDFLEGSNREDLLVGSGGDDVIEGRQGDDEIFAGDGNDLISGGYGDDILFGQDGNDSIGGGPGNDTVYGGSGHDYIRGAGDNDVLYGGVGNDRIYGAGGFDQLFGGAGIDGLSGGPSDSENPDQLRGGSDSDRFLNRGSDNIADFRSDDVEIEFRNSSTVKWKHGEIQVVDAGLESLHLRTGNNLLLKDTRTDNPIVFQKAVTLPPSLHLGQNTYDDVAMERVISFETFDHRDEDVMETVRLEVIREMAFNWADDLSISSVLPDQSNFFSEFEALSSWTSGPVEDESQFLLSDDGSQYYSVNANFADDALATFNSREDFASIWRLTFDPAASMDGILQKVAMIDLLFARFALI